MTAVTVITASDLVVVASEIQSEHDAARRCASEAVAHAIKAGEMLLQVKAALPHGAFGPWLAANVEFSDRTARGYMQLAGLDEAKRQRVADLSLREAMVAIADQREPIEGTCTTIPAIECPSVEWERPTSGGSLATWDAGGWPALAALSEADDYPGHFDIIVMVGSNAVTIGKKWFGSRPVRGDFVGAALAYMGVPATVTWNDPEALARYFELAEVDL